MKLHILQAEPWWILRSLWPPNSSIPGLGEEDVHISDHGSAVTGRIRQQAAVQHDEGQLVLVRSGFAVKKDFLAIPSPQRPYISTRILGLETLNNRVLGP